MFINSFFGVVVFEEVLVGGIAKAGTKWNHLTLQRFHEMSKIQASCLRSRTSLASHVIPFPNVAFVTSFGNEIFLISGVCWSLSRQLCWSKEGLEDQL